jgi:hypothetical protein
MKRITFILCSLPFFLLGQTAPKWDSIEYKRLGGYYVNTGFGFWDPIELSPDEFSRLWPGFNKSDYLDHKTVSSYSSGRIIEGPFYIAAGATMYNTFTEQIKRKKNLQTNMELFYYSASEAVISLEKTSWKRLDTLTSSSPTVKPYYRDSVYTRNTTFDYRSDYIGYGMSETFGTDFNRFISVYAGPGVNFRYSVNSKIIKIEEAHQSLNMTENPNENYDSLDVSKGRASNWHYTTIHNISSSVAFSLYLTGGINSRIFRTKKSQLLLNSNFRLGASWINFRRLDNTFVVGLATINFGLRYVFL